MPVDLQIIKTTNWVRDQSQEQQESTAPSIFKRKKKRRVEKRILWCLDTYMKPRSRAGDNAGALQLGAQHDDPLHHVLEFAEVD